jgi:hypothetical protein
MCARKTNIQFLTANTVNTLKGLWNNLVGNNQAAPVNAQVSFGF